MKNHLFLKDTKNLHMNRVIVCHSHLQTKRVFQPKIIQVLLNMKVSEIPFLMKIIRKYMSIYIKNLMKKTLIQDIHFHVQNVFMAIKIQNHHITQALFILQN